MRRLDSAAWIVFAATALVAACNPLASKDDEAAADTNKANVPGCTGPTCTPDPATVKDGKKDETETDVDCGGSNPNRCADGKACLEGADCASGSCQDAVCAAPRTDDGIKNGAETDVDCGGPEAPACGTGAKCAQGSDCAGGYCGVDGVCQLSPSCNGKMGAGKHCGPNLNEDCCTSARVPAVGQAVDYSVGEWGLNAHVTAYKLDKYEVTVGRMRAFFEAMDGNPRDNYVARVGTTKGSHPRIPGSGWRSSWTKRLPASWADVDTRYGDPAVAPGGGQGQFCMRGAGGDYGTTTWRHTADANGKVIENFDVKPIVCLDWYTLYAFCAWDGGRLPTAAEWGLAAGDDKGFTYSWGNAPLAFDKAVTALNGFEPFPNYSWGENTRFPGDRGTHIAPPGQKAPGQFGHYDLSGNVAEWMLDSKLTFDDCDDCANLSGWTDPVAAWPGYEPTLGAGSPTWKDGGTRVVRGGTWEGHETKNIKGVWDATEVGFTYHALGGRCARDL